VQSCKAYRHLDHSLSSRALAIEHRVQRIQNEIVSNHPELPAVQNCRELSQVGHVVVGRICPSGEGRLADEAVLLEAADGHRVPLNLHSVPSFSVFPGQVVAVKGVNSTGRFLHASEIYSDAGLRASESAASPSLDEFDSPLHIVAAYGPYTFTTDLEYLPLKDLLVWVSEQVPDVLVLNGPFVEVEHSCLKSTEATEDCDTVFRRMLSLVHNTLRNLRTKVVLVPALADAMQPYYVFPQPALSHDVVSSDPELKRWWQGEQVILASNPAILSINNIVVGMSNNDILKNMASEELAIHPTDKDKISRMLNHLLQQRSFYPLYPPAIGSQLALEQYEDVMMSVRPDVLLCTTDLRAYAKPVSGVLCVSPGRLAKADRAGSFSSLVVHRPKQTDAPREASR